ncbi:hypothetical protein FHS42_004727 [Streptomyces zagrosensis]|uniref:Uncharacterized protein n=1 Tax=Streptomyces zagrosensis TaxID=1042984 RepID=A0A7W9QCC2_9ACTN|nr:hypothetical protein [Streptomyces zagrosensis]
MSVAPVGTAASNCSIRAADIVDQILAAVVLPRVEPGVSSSVRAGAGGHPIRSAPCDAATDAGWVARAAGRGDVRGERSVRPRRKAAHSYVSWRGRVGSPDCSGCLPQFLSFRIGQSAHSGRVSQRNCNGGMDFTAHPTVMTSDPANPRGHSTSEHSLRHGVLGRGRGGLMTEYLGRARPRLSFLTRTSAEQATTQCGARAWCRPHRRQCLDWEQDVPRQPHTEGSGGHTLHPPKRGTLFQKYIAQGQLVERAPPLKKRRRPHSGRCPHGTSNPSHRARATESTCNKRPK